MNYRDLLFKERYEPNWPAMVWVINENKTALEQAEKFCMKVIESMKPQKENREKGLTK